MPKGEAEEPDKSGQAPQLTEVEVESLARIQIMYLETSLRVSIQKLLYIYLVQRLLYDLLDEIMAGLDGSSGE